jgi:hypothetical protein
MTPFTDCWLWAGANIEGYGIVRRKGKAFRVHRLLWIAINGEVPYGKELDHLCRNKLCVRPDHLEAVTHKENVLRGESPSAKNARKTVSSCGHPYTGKDPIRRYCKPCRTKWAQEYYHRNSEKILAGQRERRRL